MERELIITATLNLIFHQIREDNIPVELRVENLENTKQTGTIYKGKVKRIVPAMNAAFVDIGMEKEAFLPLKDLCSSSSGTNCEDLKIGQNLIVQIKRSPISTKGAKLTCRVSLPGKYFVLLPTTMNQISLSSKYEDPEEREELKKRILELIQPINEKNYGFIIRTSAKYATDEEIINDFFSLINLWNSILKKAKRKKAPSILYEEPSKVISILRDYAGQFDRIITDNARICKEIEEYYKSHFPGKETEITLYKKRKVSLFTKYEFGSIINKILSVNVWLKSGAYLVIEETEALVVIDVNSGSNCKEKNLEDTAFNINKEAAIEIARQLRLRDLGGIVVIDFIDMKKEKQKEDLIKIFNQELKKDKRPVRVKNFTSLGLLELTRKKIEESLTKQLSIICNTCKGKGYVKNPSVVLAYIEKAISEMRPFGKLIITVNPTLEEDLRVLLREMKLDYLIEIKTNPNLSIDKYEIERVL